MKLWEPWFNPSFIHHFQVLASNPSDLRLNTIGNDWTAFSMRKNVTIDAGNCRSLSVNQSKVGADELTLLIPEVEELTEEFASLGG